MWANSDLDDNPPNGEAKDLPAAGPSESCGGTSRLVHNLVLLPLLLMGGLFYG
jgi:hypothetical protein